MLTTFWEGLGEKLSDKWVATLLLPACIFWLASFIAWVYHSGWAMQVTWFTHLPVPEQVSVLIASLLVIVTSSAIVQIIEKPLLRLIEGYWPPWRWLSHIRRWSLHRHEKKLELAEQRWQALAQKGLNNLTPEENKEFVTLDHQLRLAPDDPAQRMPTRMGNLLRSAELRSSNKYGLDAVICWPRLWLLLPADVKKELMESRSNIDNEICNVLWGILFLTWTILAWWALPAGLLTILFCYWNALRAAEVYGDLLEAAFDLYRMALYDALRWPLPGQTATEKEYGERLTEYLFRGTLPTPQAFQHP